MQKKKILYIHHSGRLGGAPKSLSLLVQRIDREKYEPIILTIKNGPAVELLKSTGAQVIVKPYLYPYHGSTVSGINWKVFIKNHLFIIPTFFGARRIIRQINPDFIHLNSTCLFAFAAASKSLNKNRKVITHVREPLLNNIFGKILRNANYRYTDGSVSISKFDESRIETTNKPSIVVYNFIDFKTYNPQFESTLLRDEINAKQDDILLLCLARISKPNGILEVIQRFNKLPDEFKKFKLVLVGFKQNNHYENLCRKEAEGNSSISLVPFRTDAPELIASSDAFICPFTEPHFSRGIIEAAAMGKPALGNNVGGVDELIKDEETGYLMNIHSQKDFEEKLIKFKSEKQRKVMGKNAFQFAQENFEAITNAAKTYKFYEQFI